VRLEIKEGEFLYICGHEYIISFYCVSVTLDYALATSGLAILIVSTRTFWEQRESSKEEAMLRT
jgi:hypothetical protein